MQEKTIKVSKTARYVEWNGGGPVEEIWYVLHGYGQLAEYFLPHFAPLVKEGTLLIAPEALSKFYVNGFSGRVGASWMTKENRLDEIHDYIAYLTQLHLSILSDTSVKAGVRIKVLGFSQGAATASRWVAESGINLSDIILWGGFFPHDLNWQHFDRQGRNFNVHLVNGNQDTFITDEAREKMQEFLALLPFTPKQWHFEGGHEIHKETLIALAGFTRKEAN